MGLNAAGVDEVIKRVDEGHADAVGRLVLVGTGLWTVGGNSPATTIELVVGSASRGHIRDWNGWLLGRKRWGEDKG